MRDKTWVRLLDESNRLARRYRPGRNKQRQRRDDLRLIGLCEMRKGISDQLAAFKPTEA